MTGAGSPDVRQGDIAARVGTYISSEILLDRRVPLREDASLMNGLVDSTGFMELLTFLEDEFGVSLDHEDIDEENFGSVARIARFIERKIGPG